MNKKLNGFNNGRDASDGVGGNEGEFTPANEVKGCVCCSKKDIVLPLDTKLYMGFGGWTVLRNGQLFFCEENGVEFEDSKDLEYIESLIGDDTQNEYLAELDLPLRSAKYKRIHKNIWVFTEKGQGFA